MVESILISSITGETMKHFILLTCFVCLSLGGCRTTRYISIYPESPNVSLPERPILLTIEPEELKLLPDDVREKIIDNFNKLLAWGLELESILKILIEFLEEMQSKSEGLQE